MAEVNGTIEDVLGQSVNVGDTVAGAFRIGNVAVLRVGTVLGFAERGNNLTVRVQWQHSSRPHEGEIVGAIEADLQRFVRLNTGNIRPVVVPEIPEVNEEIPAINP